MKVLYLASEVVPFAQTGGLADVAAALPRAVRNLGIEVTVMMPAHRGCRTSGPEVRSTGRSIRVPIAGRTVAADLLATSLPGSDVPVLLIDQPSYFDREGIYGVDAADYSDNCERFAFFQRAALEAARALDLRPDVIHCNDWQTALVPTMLREFERHQADSPFRATGTLLTIHNLAYQGSFAEREIGRTCLDDVLMTPGRLEAFGRLNFLKAGLIDADLITTVSPTYAREIRTSELGRGLDDVLRARGDDLRGIINGIDRSIWDPATDRHLACRYDASTWRSGKAACKTYLRRRLGLADRPEAPVLAAIGRLDPQKGWDLIEAVVDDLIRREVQLVVLGTGDPHHMAELDRLASRHPASLRAIFEFSTPLAHQIQAGADLLLMPSRYEPCGLNQLYALAYGTVPVVRATGGPGRHRDRRHPRGDRPRHGRRASSSTSRRPRPSPRRSTGR